jgi:hypothetical protein
MTLDTIRSDFAFLDDWEDRYTSKISTGASPANQIRCLGMICWAGDCRFYDLDKHLEAISAKGDPLEALKAIISFESFPCEIQAVLRLAPKDRKSNAGRKPLEALAKAGLVKTLFDRLNRHLNAKGYIARGGQNIDATILSAPKQHNSREENEAIKAGQSPDGWEEKPAKNAQKDKDARWTKKNEQNFYGYKNHISVDRKHKLVRRYIETDASVHDCQKLDEVLDKSNTSNEATLGFPGMLREEFLGEGELQVRVGEGAGCDAVY